MLNLSPMKPKEARIIRRKLILSRITSTISLTLVMFMLGLIGYLLLNAHQVSVFLRENIGITLMLKDSTPESGVLKLRETLAALPQVKQITYISKEAAAKELKEELGQDFIEFLGYNPLPSALEVKVKAEFSHPDSMARAALSFQQYPEVSEVIYQKDLVSMLSRNVQKATLIFLLFSGLLIVIAISIINHSVRLSIYSKRFIIKTMQLVGASPGFIRRPFLRQSVWLGLFGSFLANVLLTGVAFWMENQVEGIIGPKDFLYMGSLYLVVFILGISLHLLFTYFSVNKYLNAREDFLYY